MSRPRRKREADADEEHPLSYRDRQAAANRRADRWCAVIVALGAAALIWLVTR